MLELKDLMPINFLKKEKFTGSFNGMRFRMEKCEREEEGIALAVTVWPEPFSCEATADGEKEQKLFSFDADGIAQGMDWLNERYQSEEERWKLANGSWH